MSQRTSEPGDRNAPLAAAKDPICATMTSPSLTQVAASSTQHPGTQFESMTQEDQEWLQEQLRLRNIKKGMTEGSAEEAATQVPSTPFKQS